MIARANLSLSRRLLIGLIAVTLVCWLVITVLTVRDSVDEMYELFDVHLAQTANALLRVKDPDDDDTAPIPTQEHAPKLLDVFSEWPDYLSPIGLPRLGGSPPESIHLMHAQYEKSMRYQIWNRGGEILASSANAPNTPITLLDGYSQITDSAGEVWRNYGVWDQHGSFRVLVSENYQLRNRIIRNITAHLASPLALGLPVMIFMLWLVIGRGLNPLGTLTRDIAARKSDNLTPINVDHAPQEVKSMVKALNDLLGRMNSTLEAERRFTANAAHELRTPLAAIQAQLYNARQANNEAERTSALEQLNRGGVERSIRLVDQLLIMARLDPDHPLPKLEPINIAEMVQNVCAELAPLALQKEQHLELETHPPLPLVSGNADMLAMLLINLLENAIHYTQIKGAIAVTVNADDRCVQIEISDNGPGIPPDQRKAVFTRFTRIAGQDQPGTGLGLAIAQRIAQLHNAQISLHSGQNQCGLTARVCLPIQG